MMRDFNRRLSLPLLLLGILAGCTSHSNYRQGEIASQLGHWDDAVLYYMKALDDDPANITYQADLLRAKIKASQEHFEKGKEYEKAGVVERALVEYQQAVQLDPTNQYAQAQLEHAHREYLAQKQGQGRRDHRADEAEEPRRPAAAAGAQPALEPADLARVPAAGVAVLDLQRPRPGVRDQHPVRSQPARPGDRDRPQGRHRPGGARDADARLRPVLQGDGRALDHHRPGHAAEPPHLRGPGHPDVLPVERRGEGHADDPAQPDRRAQDRHQRAAQRHHPARHRRQGEGRRADHRGQRQVEGRGGGGHRAAADQHPAAARPGGEPVELLGRPAAQLPVDHHHDGTGGTGTGTGTTTRPPRASACRTSTSSTRATGS